MSKESILNFEAVFGRCTPLRRAYNKLSGGGKRRRERGAAPTRRSKRLRERQERVENKLDALNSMAFTEIFVKNRPCKEVINMQSASRIPRISWRKILDLNGLTNVRMDGTYFNHELCNLDTLTDDEKEACEIYNALCKCAFVKGVTLSSLGTSMDLGEDFLKYFGFIIFQV